MKYAYDSATVKAYESHPARGAWIEIPDQNAIKGGILVAPRKGCVD